VLTDKRSGASATNGALTVGDAYSTTGDRPHNDKESRAGGSIVVRISAVVDETNATGRLPLETDSAG
jgi:hypothetical protein